MSDIGVEGRSFSKIHVDDLYILAKIAENDRTTFFAKNPQWANSYNNRFICSALCQGAGLHYISPELGVGINDFDVYNFFSNNSNKRWCSRRITRYDFGDTKFEQSIDKPRIIG